jgi:GH43 family beta-xylosidase
MKKSLILGTLLLIGAGYLRAQSGTRSLTNPLLPDGADPWVLAHQGTYYYTHTTGRNLTLWKTRHFADLKTAESKVVWTPPATGPNSHEIWAPELHRLVDDQGVGRWYLYYTATDKTNFGDHNRYVFVLENAAEDPLQGTWVDRGRVNTRYTGLDGSVFELRGKRYFVYSAYDGPESVLAISLMRNPWTIEPEVIIARPEHAWEKHQNRAICEGPEFLRRDAQSPLCIVYSASACWDDAYCLGLLTAPPDADPLDPQAWTKAPQPVFEKSAERGVYGPGHNGFLKTPDGTHWILYHAKAVANAACRARTPRLQPFGWTPDGRPSFGTPLAAGTAIPFPAD